MGEKLPTLPVFYNPLSKVDDHLVNRQWTVCAPFETDYYQCATRVGKHLAQTQCRLELEDLDECTHQTKQQKRYILLQAERRKQKLPYMEAPAKDTIMLTV